MTTLFDDLEENAMNAQDNHKNEYVEITGYLTNIDSSGKYIDLGAASDNYDYLFKQVQCYIKNDDQKSVVKGLKKDQQVTLRGKIKDVGEVLGYSLDIIEFK